MARYGADFEELALENTKLQTELSSARDEIDCLKTELFEAVSVAYARGATEWTKLNFPKWVDRIQQNIANRQLYEDQVDAWPRE